MRKLILVVQYAFGISKVEANGLVIFLPLILFIILLPMVINSLTYSEITFEEEEKQLNKLIAGMQIDSTQFKPPAYRYNAFDPNNVSPETLRAMGVNAAAAKNWQRYLENGGKFRSADEIAKIYGLNDSIFAVIKPFAVLKKTATDKSIADKKVSAHRHVQKKKLIRKAEPVQQFDLNKADTSTLKRVRGIGSVFSKRIIKYRESLGGFVSKDQLKEVYGLKDSVIQRLDTLVYINSEFNFRRLQINNSTEDELSRHPYLSRKKARAIITYRYQHGPFQTVDDLHNIHLLDSLTILRITPYLKF